MEIDKNPMPQVDLFPRITKAGNFIKRLVQRFPDGAPAHMSGHYQAPQPADDGPKQLELIYDRNVS